VNDWDCEREPDIYNRDDLGFERKFDTWTVPHGYPVLGLRYERLWENKSILERFLGFPIKMPPKRPRSTTIPEEWRERLYRVYGGLAHKIDQSPDVFFLGSEKHANPSVEDIPSPPKSETFSVRKARIQAWVHERLFRKIRKKLERQDG
jgi:hypothetical protein